MAGIKEMQDYHVLVTCVDRQVHIQLFPDYKSAFQEMLGDLKSIEDWKHEGWDEIYEENKDADGCCEDCDEFGITKTAAWADADRGDNQWDWKIKSIEELLSEMKGRETEG